MLEAWQNIGDQLVAAGESAETGSAERVFYMWAKVSGKKGRELHWKAKKGQVH